MGDKRGDLGSVRGEGGFEGGGGVARWVKGEESGAGDEGEDEAVGEELGPSGPRH